MRTWNWVFWSFFLQTATLDRRPKCVTTDSSSFMANFSLRSRYTGEVNHTAVIYLPSLISSSVDTDSLSYLHMFWALFVKLLWDLFFFISVTSQSSDESVTCRCREWSPCVLNRSCLSYSMISWNPCWRVQVHCSYFLTPGQFVKTICISLSRMHMCPLFTCNIKF